MNKTICDNLSISFDDKGKISHHEDVMKQLFYTCEKCDGAFIQTAACIVCKKTILRICIRCNVALELSHFSCRISQHRKVENLEMII